VYEALSLISRPDFTPVAVVGNEREANDASMLTSMLASVLKTDRPMPICSPQRIAGFPALA
jgi:hypothetical protein